MRAFAGGCLVLLLCGLAPRPADAGLVCGRTVVLPGATAREVLEKCGSPTRRQGLDGKPRAGRAKGGGGRRGRTPRSRARQLVRYLTFDRGRLRSIDFGGYGR